MPPPCPFIGLWFYRRRPPWAPTPFPGPCWFIGLSVCRPPPAFGVSCKAFFLCPFATRGVRVQTMFCSRGRTPARAWGGNQFFRKDTVLANFGESLCAREARRSLVHFGLPSFELRDQQLNQVLPLFHAIPCHMLCRVYSSLQWERGEASGPVGLGVFWANCPSGQIVRGDGHWTLGRRTHDAKAQHGRRYYTCFVPPLQSSVFLRTICKGTHMCSEDSRVFHILNG